MMRTMKQWQVTLIIGLLLGLNLSSVGPLTAAAQESKEPTDYETGFYYTVKSGDTLWDLSQRFNDTPWQWPDLWQENKQIGNPHWIYPGERIRLFRKAGQQEMKATAQPKPPVSASTAAPEPRPAPEVHYRYSNINHVGFIRKPAVTPLGTIFKARDNKSLISKGDMVYIHANPETNNELNPGMRLMIYRTLSPTGDRNSEKAIGTQHLLIGMAEVARNEPNYTLAKILSSNRSVQIDDLVMAYQAANPEILVVDSTPGMEGCIIGGEEHSQFMGELFVAFIDKGRQDRIVPGQIYTLYYQEDELLDKIDIGSFIVLHTEDTTSTVMITDSARQIVAGQPFHTP